MRSFVRAKTLRRAALVAAAAIGLFIITLPLLLVIWLSFFEQEIPSVPPQGYALTWYPAAFANKDFVSGIATSLRVSFIATIVGVTISLPAALVISRKRIPAPDWFLLLLLLPMMVPNIVMGASIYIGQIETELQTELRVIGSTAGLVVAHVLLVIPWAVRLIVASLSTVNPSLEEAAKNLGATPLVAFYHVLLPAIRPGLVAASLFGFVVSFGNLELSMFLVGAGETTLPIAILQYLEWKIDPTVAAISASQILIVALAMVITNRFVKLTQVV